ncbi:MAG TPA: uridine kinase [Saprospiraceae bacterium]|nr:uridine kinase [Saprospiraceae bacterium]
MLIGITGGSGSGKTSFINHLREQFSENELGLLSMDNYYKQRHEQQKDPQGEYNYDTPDSFIIDDFIEDLRKLKRHEEVRRKEYTFNNDTKAAGIVITPPAHVYIIEGLFLVHDQRIRQLLDLTILIQAKEELKIIRRILRDQKERNYPMDDVLYKYQHHVGPAFDKYIRPHIADLDLIINNNSSYSKALDVIAAYVREHCKGK